MSGGKIDPKIEAAAEAVVARMRDELEIAVAVVIKTIARQVIPLQQDVKKLKQDVRHLEQGRDPPPTLSEGKVKG